MKAGFGILLVIHGLVHFLGFARAYHIGTMEQFSKDISKPLGWLWLGTGLLFIIIAILLLIKKENWHLLAILAVVLSQFLIVLFWQDAKYGTIANLIILLVAISAYGNFRFNKMVKRETEELLQAIQFKDRVLLTDSAINGVPEIVQKWLRNSGVVGKEKIVSVRLKQRGKMKTKPEGEWMSFTAQQYFDVSTPSFVWSTEVDFMPVIKMAGRDKFVNGKGEMLIKMASLIPVVDEGNNAKINSAAMIRYMAEMTWFPSAALSRYIQWESLDANRAKATFTLNGKSVSGIFKFSEDGEMQSFEAKRYFGGGNHATIETWLVYTKGHKDFNGIEIPAECEVIWKLKEGDFNWLIFEITDLEFNTNAPYD